MLKNNKGISLITAIMTVVIMIILLTTITYTAQKNIRVKKINQLYSDLRELTDAVQLYYVKHDKLPVSDEVYIVSEDSVQKEKSDGTVTTYTSIKSAGLGFVLKSGVLFTKENLYNPNDYDNSGDSAKAVYYVIDLSLFDNITLNNEGTYLVNEKSKTVFYYNGVEVENKTHHTLPLNYTDIPYDVKENGSTITVSDIYIPVYRTQGTTLNLKNFFVLDKEPRLIEFSIIDNSGNYFSVDEENSTITSVKSSVEGLDLPSAGIGVIEAIIYAYGSTENFVAETDVFVTEVYLEEKNNIITNIEDELKTIYIPVNGTKTIVANKNGAAGNLKFLINNNCDTNNTTEVSYTADENESVNSLENGFKNVYINAGSVTGKALLTVTEGNGNAYKNLNINIVNPVLIVNDETTMNSETSEMIEDVLTETNYKITLANTTTSKTIDLSGLDDIDWTIVGNSITWTLELNDEGASAEDIIELTQETDNVVIKARGVNGDVNLKCKITIGGSVIKEIVQPINVTISE